MITHFCKQGSRMFDVEEYTFDEWLKIFNPAKKKTISGKSFYECQLCKNPIKRTNEDEEVNKVYVIRNLFSFCHNCWEHQYKESEMEQGSFVKKVNKTTEKEENDGEVNRYVMSVLSMCACK